MRRPIRVGGDIAFISLTKGYEAMIDVADVPLVDGASWFAIVGSHAVYAQRNGWVNGKRVAAFLHRVLLGAPAGLQVDHINGDGLDNRRLNLRLATHAENQRNQRLSRINSSGFKGVGWDHSRGKWRAQIMRNGRNKYLGLFDTPEAAHAAYVEAAKQLHGEFGRAA